MPTRFRPRLEPVEARLTPAFPVIVLDGSVLVPDPAGGGLFRVVAPGDGTDLGDVTPFPGWTGEVRSATIPKSYPLSTDLVVAAGPGGGSRVRVFDGNTREPRLDFLAFEPEFRGGVYVATLDVSYDGYADIVVGAGEGGSPRVRVFDGRSGRPIADFLAFEADFRGGVRVAAGDLGGDGRSEIVAGAGPGGAPRVSVFEWRGFGPGRPTELATFFAYDPTFRGGVSVAVSADPNFYVFPFTGKSLGLPPSLVTAPGVGGGPQVRVFDGRTGAETATFLVGDPADRGGLSLTGYASFGFGTGVVVTSPTSAGPSFVGVATTGGPPAWVRPPDTVRTYQQLASVDLDSRVVTFLGGGSAVVRPDAVLRFDSRTVTLDAFEPGDGVVTLVGATGELLGLDGRSPTSITVPLPPIDDTFQ